MRQRRQDQEPVQGQDQGVGTLAVFSPRRGLRVLDWYAALAGQAQEALFMTFAFGMHKSLLSVYDQTDAVLRSALMEKEGSGAGLAQARIDIRRVRRRPNVLIAIGGRIITNRFDRWLREIDRIVAEAHFSAASTDTNDENMLVIRNDKRVADIYLGEYMRLFSHYAFGRPSASTSSRRARPRTGSRTS